MDIKKHKLGLSYRSKPKYLTRDYILDTKRNLNQEPFTHTPLNRDETRGPDIYQIQNELNKYRSKDDQLKTYDNLDKTSYPSDPNKVSYNPVKGQFQKGDKFEALSAFKDDLKKEETLFTNILINLNERPKLKSKVINNKFETDFKRGKKNALKEFYPKPKVSSSQPKEVLPKPTAPEPIKVVEPQRDLSEIIAEAAEGTKQRELKQETRRYGNKGLGFLNLKNRGLND
tara:strand:- start:6295 stop:6981 length:687 start_codon:yes stop_codon:yes gene_type:complete